MTEIFTQWQRESERRPFNTEVWNRLMRWFSGYASGPLLLVDNSGNALLSVNGGSSTVDLGGVFAVSSTFGARLDNAVWLLARNAANSANVNLLRLNATNTIELGQAAASLSVLASLTNNVALLGRNAAGSGDVTVLKVNASDIIELGADGTRLSPLSPITNNVALGFRNAANSATVAALLLNASDYFELGAAGTRITISSPLTNNTPLYGRNAANSANVALVNLNASNQVDLGAAGTQANLLGTVVATAIDPPTINGQVTVGSQCSAFAYVTAGGGASLGNNYNVASVTRNVAGDFTIAWDRDFAAATYAVIVTVEDNALTLLGKVNSQTASSCDVHVLTTAGTKTDPDAFSVVAFGTLS